MGAGAKASDGKRYGWDAYGADAAMTKAKQKAIDDASPEALVAQKGRQDNERAAMRGWLAMSTLGTSEIKTGAGEYGDETVADSLFPKTVNDALLQRTGSRAAIDAQRKADADAMAPPPPPDPSSKLLAQTQRAAMLRAQAKQGRKNAFATSDPYGVKK